MIPIEMAFSGTSLFPETIHGIQKREKELSPIFLLISSNFIMAPEAHWAFRGITGKSGPAKLTAKKAVAAGDLFFLLDVVFAHQQESGLGCFSTFSSKSMLFA